MMPRVCGIKQETHKPTDWPVSALLRTQTSNDLPAPDHTEVTLPRRFQGSLPGCWGMMITRLVCRWFRLNQRPGAPEPSAMHAWAEARLQEYAGQDTSTVPKLQLVGVYASHGMQSVRKKGLVRWNAWPWKTAFACVKPPPFVTAKAYGARGFEYYRATTLAQASEAMRKRYTVGVSMLVDDAFKYHLGMNTIQSINPIGAEGHAMAVLKIDMPNRRVLVENWWDDWGMPDGTAWVSSDLLDNMLITKDIWVVRYAPEVRP
jgi:hypothetical protein